MNHTLLKKLVSINSTYPNENKLAEFLVEYLSQTGFTVTTQKVAPHRFNIAAQKGIGPKALMFLGHMDTTHSGELVGWRTNPHTLTQKNGRLYGLGAYDMKGGLAAFITAAKNSSAYIKLLLTVDEENISTGAWLAVKKYPDFFKDVSLIISAEPSLGFSDASITTSRTGRLLYQAEFNAPGMHIALKRKHPDTVKKAGDFISRLYSQNHLFSSPQTLFQIRKIAGEAVGMSVCSSVRIEIEVLPGPKDSALSVLQVLKKLSLSASIRLKARPTPYLSGYSFSDFPYKAQIRRIIFKRTREKMRLVSRTSVADDNVLATLKIPVITWGPSGDNAHMANEYVNASSLTRLFQMYSDLLFFVKLTG